MIAFSAVALLIAAGFAGSTAAPTGAPRASVQDLVPGLDSAVDADDGVVGDEGLSVSDTDQPAIARLDPDLVAALRVATADAESDGIALIVKSGWRSRALQQNLLDDAIKTYGSRTEAERWVATPESSRHVTGNAVDIGPTDAAYWMNEHGVHYGLCQAYSNEIWHYELLTTPDGTCPVPLEDAAS